MTGVPQDGRSPYRQARMIAAYNSGSADIPAHGVVEIDTNAIVEAEFRDYLSVKRPTSYGLPNIAVNGMMPIKVGKTGFVTWDWPAYFMGEAGLLVGHMAGTQTGSFKLAKGYPGLMVDGPGPVNQSSSGNTLYRGTYLWCPVVRGTLGAELCPTDPTATISTSWVAVRDLGITTADNVFALAAPSGSPCELNWNGQTNAWEVLQVKHRSGQIVTDIGKGSCSITKTIQPNVSLMYCGTPTTSVAVQMFSKTFLTALQLSDTMSGSGSGTGGACKLQTNSMTVCAFDDAGPNGLTDAVTFESTVILQTMRQTGLCLEGKIQTIFVPCSQPGEWVNLVCGTACQSGSGS